MQGTRKHSPVLSDAPDATLGPCSDEQIDQTPPPDHEEFERVSARGLRAIKERWERRRRKT
jgi:hypothetical protein